MKKFTQKQVSKIITEHSRLYGDAAGYRTLMQLEKRNLV